MATITTGMLSNVIINGIKVNTSVPCSSSNYNNASSRNVQYVVMHYTAGAKDTAKGNCQYFKSASRGSSAHLFVDNDSIYQSVELRDKAWHCGTSGAYYHTECRNSNSIGIEMCCTDGAGVVSLVTMINSMYVCAHICKMLGINSSSVDKYVVRHYDITHKVCPKPFVNDANQWNTFKQGVKNILNTGNWLGTTSSKPTLAIPDKTLKQGASGNDVKNLQNAINVISGKQVVTVDSSYGAKTTRAVKDIQTLLKAFGMYSGAIDGIWGHQTFLGVKASAESKGYEVIA